MKQYLELCEHVLKNGQQKGDRTGTGTISLFGTQSRYDLTQGFPVVTTKKVHWKSVVHELLWFIKGDTNVAYLQENGVRIWNEWADEQGELGPVYGAQWRCWQDSEGKTHDQLAQLVTDLKNNPMSRRLILSAWNVGEIDKMALPPCHAFVQFYVSTDRKLSCQLYQRSADIFLGVPFNIASYALLTYLLAQVCDLEVGEFIHTLGDAHIYNNHFPQVELQLTRAPKGLPKLQLNPEIRDIEAFTFDDIELVGYESHPHIAGKVSV
ncbi:MAG: thymidylate synthase [Culicoidibacterales bacterium]